MSKREFPGLFRVLLAAWAISALTYYASAQAPLETSTETRFQLDLQVPEEALKPLIPAGLTPSVATKGPAKDCNLRVLFVDRITVNAANGKPIGTGSTQFVQLTVPVMDKEGAYAQLVIGGLSGDPADVPGAFGVNRQAATHTMQRTISSGTGPVIETEDWVFRAASGEHLEMHIKFERGNGFKIPAGDVKFYSSTVPGVVQISRDEQRLDILRNVTTTPSDRIQSFSFEAGGGSYSKLFNGREKLLSWDNVLWMNRTVKLP